MMDALPTKQGPGRFRKRLRDSQIYEHPVITCPLCGKLVRVFKRSNLHDHFERSHPGMAGRERSLLMDDLWEEHLSQTTDQAMQEAP